MKTPSSAFLRVGARQRGVALVIVLALLVIVLGVVVAFFSQSGMQQQISASSANQTSAELLALGAANTIVGDLQKEIREGSSATQVGQDASGEAVYLFSPDEAKNAVPALSGVPLDGSLPNLLKRSSGDVFAPGVPTRASGVPTDAESRNGRSISLERWNAPLLMEAQSFDTPTPPPGFDIPNWIYLDRKGSNPTSGERREQDVSDEDVIVGRYAFTIYNEGGLLDANVAGHTDSIKADPSGASLVGDQTLFRTSQSYADLTRLPGWNGRQALIDEFVQWRNAATLGAGSDADKFLKFATANKSNFLSVTENNAGGGPTDKRFVSRQQLIDFFANKLDGKSDKAVLDALQYLGTFSRTENRPSYFPDGFPDGSSQPSLGPAAVPGGKIANSAYDLGDENLNPAFGEILVQSEFTRADGSQAKVGEPLVKKRFPLNRLAWVTYKGPSADIVGDPLYEEYEKYGISEEFLMRGTADNIEKNFGLQWVESGSLPGYWQYIDKYKVQNGSAKTLAFLDQVADGVAGGFRDPNFFELLQAAVHAGSLGKAKGQDEVSSFGSGGNDVGRWLANQRDFRVDFQALAIGANMIDQASPDSFATRIVFDDDSWQVPFPFWGKVDLPYLMGLVDVGVVTRRAVPEAPPDMKPVANQPLTDVGELVALTIPIIWNPHQRLTEREVNSALAPRQLRISISSTSLFTPLVQATNWRRRLFFKWNGQEYPGVTPGQHGHDVPGMPLYANWYGGTVDSNTGEANTSSGTTPTAIGFLNLPSQFREPTPLWSASLDDQEISMEDNGAWTSLGLPANGVTEATSGRSFIGFPMAKVAARWTEKVTVRKEGPPVTTEQVDVTYTVNSFDPQGGEAGFTVSMEYRDPQGNWVPYQQYPIRMLFTGQSATARPGDQLVQRWLNDPRNGDAVGTDFKIRMNAVYDPRSMRWGAAKDMHVPRFLDTSTFNQVTTLRPAKARGPYRTHGQDIVDATTQNLKTPTTESFADPDGVRRRAMGGYVPGAPDANFEIGLPMATVAGNSANESNRPIILNRPFKSVAELGYVFRDTPWKNLDFFTTDSGDKALLDVFCISEDERLDSLTAGKVDLNTRQAPVLEALLANVYRDENNPELNRLSNTEAETFAQDLLDITDPGNSAPGEGPLTNIADLIARQASGSGASATFKGFVDQLNQYAGGSSSPSNVVQRFREAAIRALADTGQVGTWNLMIDVVAQAGRLTGNSLADDFVVDGEQRLWVHLAIDRQTGRVIDRQIEVVKE